MPSKRSEAPSHPSGPERSTTSWAIPEPADVICYSYLWAREAAKGQEEGLKDRPVVVVLAQLVKGEHTQLIVAPVTHSETAASDGVEIPRAVKRHLGLDDGRSWIITTEVNRFVWPGPDVRPAKAADTPFFGTIPAKLFEQVRQQISDHARMGRVPVTKRKR